MFGQGPENAADAINVALRAELMATGAVVARPGVTHLRYRVLR